jgi:hypothetical protein
MNLQFLIEMLDKAVTSEEHGHWDIMPYLLDQDPTKSHGFIYCVENTETNKLYIGRKQTVQLGKKSSKTYGKVTNWKTYMGSSKHLTDDIKSLGKDKFKFIILEFYQTRGGLNYAEIAFQVKCDVMTAKLPNGERQFYNGQVGAVRWVPKEYISEEHRKAIHGAWTGSKHTEETKLAISESKLGDKNPQYNKLAEDCKFYKGASEGTCVKTGDIIVLKGTKAIKDAGFCEGHISSVITGKRKTHKGYTWKRI